MYAMHAPSLSGIDLNLLVVLRALLSERHVTRAAAQVGLSQSATSHALSRLRELYGDPLMVRNGRALVLTPRAQQIWPLLERGLSELDSSLAAAPSFDPKTARREFRIGTADYGQALLVAPLLAAIGKLAPHVRLNVVNASSFADLIEAGGIDLGLVVGEKLGTGTLSETLFRDRYLCMARRAHPSAGKRLTLKQYLALSHAVVAPTGSPGSIVDTALARRGAKRHVAVRVSSFLVAPIVVCASDLINTGPARLAKQLARVHPIKLFEPPLELPEFELDMAWHPRDDHDPAHRFLREVLRSVCSKL